MKKLNFSTIYFRENEPFCSAVFLKNAFGWFLVLSFSFIQIRHLSAQCSVAFTQCPGSISIVDCDHSGDEALQWPLVIANTSGFCTGYTLTQNSGQAPGSIVPLGTYSIGYTAQVKDLFSSAMSTATCNFSVSVIADPTPPTFVNCPPNITVMGVDNGSGSCSAQAFWTNPIASDACGNTVAEGSGTTPCGTSFSAGAHTVTYTATDPSGNSATCSFTVTVLCPVKVSEPIKSAYQVSLHPNPNSGAFTVTLSEPATPVMTFHITDLAGRLVQVQKTEPGSKEQTVHADPLPPGLYFLQVTSNNKILATQKFVKQ